MPTPLKYQEVRVGLRVVRIEADPKEHDKAEDLGRVGTVQPNSAYNNMAHTMTVKYDPHNGLPEKVDDCCTVFEFAKHNE